MKSKISSVKPPCHPVENEKLKQGKREERQSKREEAEKLKQEKREARQQSKREGIQGDHCGLTLQGDSSGR